MKTHPSFWGEYCIFWELFQPKHRTYANPRPENDGKKGGDGWMVDAFA